MYPTFRYMRRSDQILGLRSGCSTLNTHTAFEDPTTQTGTPLRESIDFRIMAFF